MGLIDQLFRNTKLAWLINHRNFYLLGLAITLGGLGWANAMMSIGNIVLGANWLLELNYKKRLSQIRLKPVFLALLSLYIIHIIGGIWSTNMGYFGKEIGNKIPLFVFPFVIGTSAPLNKKEWGALLKIYLSGLFILTLISYGKLIGIMGYEYSDKRQLANFVSHIRYGLNIAFAAASVILFKDLIKHYLLRILLFFYFSISLVSFELYSGLICLLAVLIVLPFLVQNRVLKRFILSISVMACLFLGFQFYSVYQDYHRTVVPQFDLENLAKRSSSGEIYSHAGDTTEKENGIPFWLYVAEGELSKAWNKRSRLSYDGEDLKGQELKRTLIRFMASKGLKKDSAGLSKLNDEEIKAVESGIPNVYYTNHNKLQNRIHRTLYELDIYKNRNYNTGFSIAMRFEYWKTALQIIKDNPIIGVGTGDVQDAFNQQYEINQSSLSKNYRRRSHNQYLSIGVALGIFGTVCFLTYLILPLFYLNTYNLKIYLAFFVIASLSFITEDTLETQAGVTFFAIFNSLILLGLTQDQTAS